LKELPAARGFGDNNKIDNNQAAENLSDRFIVANVA
jgi:hypothetical protein